MISAHAIRSKQAKNTVFYADIHMTYEVESTIDNYKLIIRYHGPTII
jgi:hypothetical protein